MAGREDSEWKLEGLGLIPFQHSQGPVSTFASKRVSGSGENRIQLARQTFLLLQRNIVLFSFPISSFVSESGHRKRYEFSYYFIRNRKNRRRSNETLDPLHLKR